MTNTRKFINYIRDLIAKDDFKTAIQKLSALLKDSPLLDQAVQQSARYNNVMQQIRLGLVDFPSAIITQNQIRYGVLELLREIEEQEHKPDIKAEMERSPSIVNSKNVVQSSTITAGGNLHIGDIITDQKHTGSGDNIAGDKIGRQINMKNGTYNENATQKDTTEKVNPDTPKAETPSGLLAILLGWLPEYLRPFFAIALLVLVAYVGYHYFIPKNENKKEASIPQKEASTPQKNSTPTKVYVSGKIFVNNGEPKPNEIKRLVLSAMDDVNEARIDGTGKFTFENVTIPTNKKLLIEVTFADDKVRPTEEINTNKVNPDNNTVSLPNLYITRPQPAKGGKPATGWKIQVNVNTGNGTLNPTQN